MLYLANPSTRQVRDEMVAGRLGCILTPAQGNRLPQDVLWSVDNGCGPGRAGIRQGTGYPGETAYGALLAELRDEAYTALQQRLKDPDDADPYDPFATGCLFAAAPDVVGDAAATIRLAETTGMLDWIRYIGLPAAFVAQDGLEDLTPPWDDFDVLFIGGTTAWKLGPHIPPLVREAHRRFKNVHMGRVNSLKRLRYADAIGCDTADGTYLTYGPDTNLPTLLGWGRAVNDQATLFDITRNPA